MVVSEFVQSIRPLMAKFGINAPDVRIHGMTLDSRKVSSHIAFVAIKGHQQDGRDFIQPAIQAGAPVVFTQTLAQHEHGKVESVNHAVIIYLFELPNILSSIAGAFYDYPANKLVTTAVTGTNGKTSTVNLIAQCKRLLGTRSAAIGTLGSAIEDATETSWSAPENANTTPNAIHMQYLIAEFVQQGAGHLAFEASSHALVQHRLTQINTDVVVFTNLTRDHLDYHGSMEKYAAAKLQLLSQPGVKAAVINGDDPWSSAWIDEVQKRQLKGVVTAINRDSATILPQFSHCIASNIVYHDRGCSFHLQSSWGSAEVNTVLMGSFNVRNLLSAIACLLVQGERFEEVMSVVPKLKAVAGRMEVFSFAQRANIVVDYAHTPDALENALSAITQHVDKKPWCVFGCGGDRDKGKRPEMAKIAEQLSERIVITTDNARSEEPANIEQDIRAGLANPERAISLPVRQQAIQYCLENAPEDTLVLVAGKGHEAYQVIHNEHIHYDERAFVMQLQGEFAQ